MTPQDSFASNDNFILQLPQRNIASYRGTRFRNDAVINGLAFYAVSEQNVHFIEGI